MASGFTSERCPASPRNRVRLQVGIASGIASEYLAGISRNLQSEASGRKNSRPISALQNSSVRSYESPHRRYAVSRGCRSPSSDRPLASSTGGLSPNRSVAPTSRSRAYQNSATEGGGQGGCHHSGCRSIAAMTLVILWPYQIWRSAPSGHRAGAGYTPAGQF
jgi:hypothetical protein